MESITSFKGSSKIGYKVMVKWGGYEEGNDTPWEPVNELLQQWDCEASDIYAFFQRENIDVSKCNGFDFIKRRPFAKEKVRKTKKKEETRKKKALNKGKEKATQGTKNNILCDDIRDDRNVSDPGEHQNKEYICNLPHTAKSGSLKGEDNPKYADSNAFLHGKNCTICEIPFEGSEKLSGTSFKISRKNLVYACVDQACNYFMCGDCYKSDLLS